MKQRLLAAATLAGLLITALGVAPRGVYAGSKGRKLTTVILGAGAVGLLGDGKGSNDALVAGLAVGTIVAHKRYRDKKERERADASYRRGYRGGYQAASAKRRSAARAEKGRHARRR